MCPVLGYLQDDLELNILNTALVSAFKTMGEKQFLLWCIRIKDGIKVLIKVQRH